MSSFRVLQFNMQFGQEWHDAYPDRAPIDLEKTLTEIRRHDADIIHLQEVEQALPGGVQLQPPPNYSRLKAALRGYDSYFSYPKADQRELPFGLGLAIFSRTPLRETVRLDLPSPPIEFDFFGRKTTPTDRVMIGAKTTIHDREVQLFNVHLLAFFMLGATSEVNHGQRDLVEAQLAASRLPTVLTGDFNVSKHHTLIEQFGRVGYATAQQKEITWRRRPYVLDHAFYNPQLRCTACKVEPTPASDHHVLVADFEFV